MSVMGYLQKRNDFVGEAIALNAVLSMVQSTVQSLRAHPAGAVVLNTQVSFPESSVQWATTRINGHHWLCAERLARRLKAFQEKRAAMHEAWEKLAPEHRVGIPKPAGDNGM